jgi:hypothetical protein
MHAGLSEAHLWVSDAMLTAVSQGQRDIDAVHIPEGLLRWIAQIANDLALVTQAAFDKNEE